ncbi:MAG: M23 family metallopeptidase, partial [Tannerellaceae bacterium]|nr:M23 family metallopeptidase [Tannerellaceae bacterium]
GRLVVNGEPADDQLSKNTLVQGEDGEEYVYTGDRQVMGKEEFAATGGNSRLLDSHHREKEEKAQPTVQFSASPQQIYGFDAYNEQKSGIQQEYPELKQGYRPAFKSIASFATDRVKTDAVAGITFRDAMGIPPQQAGDELTLRGGAGGDEKALYAYSKDSDTTETVTGKLNVLSFDKNYRKVYLVPVNGAKLPNTAELARTLNNIYAQAVTDWTVEAKPNLQVSFPSGSMTHGGSNAVSVYNADQKAVIKAFGNIENDALYLFFVANVQGKDGDIGGYMPLQRQAGFIYDLPNNELIAHELAHGAFNLRHTFSEDAFVAAQGSTDNLMDYKGNTELWHHQWKKIQNPERVWMAFAEEEEEGEMTIHAVNNANMLKLMYEMRTANIRNDKNLDISEWRKTEGVNFNEFKINSLDTTLSNIHFSSMGDTAIVNIWKIDPSERNIESISEHPETTIKTGTFVKYRFRENNTSTTYKLEITVSITDTFIFNSYLYPAALPDSVRLGDPKDSPTVPSSPGNAYYGYFGCTRYEAGKTCTYPQGLTYSGKNRKHDGVDIKTTVGENLYAVYGGEVVEIDNSFEPQNSEYANDREKDYRGMLSNKSTVQVYTYTKADGTEEKSTIPANTTVGQYGCHYGSSTSYGNKVVIKVTLDKPVKDINGNDKSVIYMRYMHLNTVNVTKGQKINQGDIIGTAGCSGNAARIAPTLYHVHIEANSTNTWTGNRDIDPLSLLTTKIARPQ